MALLRSLLFAALAVSLATAQVVPLTFAPSSGVRTRTYKMGSRSVTISSKNGGDYIAPVVIGTNTFQMILDTGSSNLAVAGSECSCAGVPSFTASGSHGAAISVKYGSGSWSGYEYTDTVSFGGYKQSVTFAVISSQTTFFYQSSTNSGILGLAFQQIAENNIPPLLKSYGVGQFGLQLCRGQGSSAGNMVLGGAAGSNSFFSGSLQFTPLTPVWFSTPAYYTITANSLSVGGKQAISSFNPIVDSGTNSLVLPTAAYNSLVKAIQSSTTQSVSMLSPCPSVSSLPDIKVSINDQYGSPFTLTITSNDYCPYIDGERRFMVGANDQFHILGTPLLNHYYAMFDKTNQRVGFAPLSGCATSLDTVSTAADTGDRKASAEEGLSRTAVAGIASAATLAVVGVVAAVAVVVRRRKAAAAEDAVPMVKP